MADNIPLNPGQGGATVRTDDIGGVHYPVTKLALGLDNADNGFVANTNPMPVVTRTSAGAEITPLAEGTDITGAALPAGGASARGWLSAIWKALTDRLPAVLVGGRLDVNVGNSPAVDTELPAAAALADNMANPTAPAVGAFGMVLDSAGAWRRVVDWKKAYNSGLQLDGVLAAGTCFIDNTNAVVRAWQNASGDNFSPVFVPCVGPMLYNGVGYDRARAVTTLKTAQGTALANGADVTVWTPATGKKFRLRSITIAASVAGRYEVRDAAATVIMYLRLAANTPHTINLDANGYLSSGANQALLVRNQSGAAADVDVVASGNEE